jgi:hypothetical protein
MRGTFSLCLQSRRDSRFPQIIDTLSTKVHGIIFQNSLPWYHISYGLSWWYSRACRLKKKAQHEANKLKLYGLEQEHSMYIWTIELLVFPAYPLTLITFKWLVCWLLSGIWFGASNMFYAIAQVVRHWLPTIELQSWMTSCLICGGYSWFFSEFLKLLPSNHTVTTLYWIVQSV